MLLFESLYLSILEKLDPSPEIGIVYHGTVISTSNVGDNTHEKIFGMKARAADGRFRVRTNDGICRILWLEDPNDERIFDLVERYYSRKFKDLNDFKHIILVF